MSTYTGSYKVLKQSVFGPLCTSAQQLHRYLSVVNSAAVDPITDEDSRMDKLIVDFALLRPLFARVFCVPARSAPVERIFSQTGIIMSARRARMSSSLFGCPLNAMHICRSFGGLIEN